MSFADELKKAAARDELRLHTPGHKGKLSPLDLTELTDDSFPDFALGSAQSFAAKTYGAKHLRYLCGGSSQGVKSAVYYGGGSGIVDINSHRSVFDGFKLLSKPCITVGEKNGVFPITVKDIDGALTPDIKTVVVTSPTYYGYCADVVGIRDYCKKKGLLFICDSAHGAHFGFGERLPKSVAPYCDICNLSTHKTLSALTQTALMLDNLSDSESEKLHGVVDIMGSTSPSYLLYASIDYAVRRAATEETRAHYDALCAPIEQLKREYPFLNNDDYTRPVLDCTALGVSSVELNKRLCALGVYPERVDEKRIVFIFTAEDTPGEVIRLGDALHKALEK
ncbi:MAG: hypothetical protein HDT28_09710 [Clostridiales bacterium]|nr:hypothetical protein [Clostridiales bacterium]